MRAKEGSLTEGLVSFLIFSAVALLLARAVSLEYYEPTEVDLHSSPTETSIQTTHRTVKYAYTRYISKVFKVPEPLASRVVNASLKFSKENGIDHNLVLAIIATESSFRVFATSNVGAVGLMQVYSGKRVYNIDENIKEGIGILQDKMGYSRGNVPLALAYYNGHYTVEGGSDYVHRVYHYYYQFRWIETHAKR